MATTKEQLASYLQDAKPTLIEFYAAWCSHCQAMMPVMEKLKAKVGDKANIIQIDVDENKDLAVKYRVRVYPTWIIYKDGQEFWRDGGEKPLSELEDMIGRVI